MRNILIPIIAIALLGSCSTEWDDHYDMSGTVPQQSLMQTIAADTQLGQFADMLKATGYDSILSSSQTYTVWAPTNDALYAASISGTEDMLRVVRNHIARYSNPTSIGLDKKVNMLNGKSIAYDAADDFGGAKLAEANIAAKNGVLHKVENTIPYKYNIREYIDGHSECKQISRFIAGFDKKEYDESLSTTYDSVFVNYNALLHHPVYGIGAIENEDSTYCMVVPTDLAWQKAYDKLNHAFNNYNADAAVADSIQHVQTAQMIVRALASKTLDENQLATYERVEASNGVIYLANDEILNIDTCLTNAVVKVEAENMDGRVNLTGTSTYIRMSDINSAVQDISDNSYLEVSSGNVDGGVIFDIPNVMAQKYDVYVDFVSPVIDGESQAEQKTKVVFQMRYLSAVGRTTTVNNNAAKEISAAGGDIISVKAFSNVSMPVADYHDKLWLSDENNSAADINNTTTLQVKTKVSSSDARKGYTRLFRIDRIRFVPVAEAAQNQ